MGEFFVLAKFQRKGVAYKAAQQIFTDYPGKWSIAVMPENIKALNFWRKIITDVSEGNYTKSFKAAKDFDSYNMNIFVFEVGAPGDK